MKNVLIQDNTHRKQMQLLFAQANVRGMNPQKRHDGSFYVRDKLSVIYDMNGTFEVWDYVGDTIRWQSFDEVKELIEVW